MLPNLLATTALNHPLIARGVGKRHLLCGSGGSRAILGSAGFILACEIAELTEWLTIGGISGGSIPTLLKAQGVPGKKLVRLGIGIDFTDLVTKHANPISILLAFLMKDRFEQTRPRQGVMNSEKLGEFVDSLGTVWPKNYWTMAVVGRTQIIFTADGVYQFAADGSHRQISDKPAPLGLAIRASCAVPGIIDAPYFLGKYLFDGALSWDGACPSGVLIRNFGATPESIVACDVSDPAENKTFWNRWKLWFWRMLCGKRCVVPVVRPTLGTERVLTIRPPQATFGALQFKLTEEQKWEAVHQGFVAAVRELEQAGLLTGAKLEDAHYLAADVERLKTYCAD